MTRAPLLQTKAPPTAKDDVDHSGVALGSVLVSLLEPERGREAAFHRWYERDHFYAGCMVVPWFFAGRRFVATRELKALRAPRDPRLDGDGVAPLFEEVDLPLTGVLARMERAGVRIDEAKLDDLATLPLDCEWSDLGGWAALAELLPQDGDGTADGY